MIETIIKCDKCGKPGAKSYQYFLGKEPDPSGNGYINNVKNVDFCHKCMIEFVRGMDESIELLDYSNRYSFLK